MIWEDIVGCSRNCPAPFSRNFSAQAQDQDGGGLLSSSPGSTGRSSIPERFVFELDRSGILAIRFRGW
jgi:hypothetical protein